jgi:hypothetical protein
MLGELLIGLLGFSNVRACQVIVWIPVLFTVQIGREFHGQGHCVPRSKFTLPRFYHVPHLCPLYIIIANTNPKSAFAKDTEWKGISVSRSLDQGQRSHHHYSTMRHTFVHRYIILANNIKSAFVQEIQSGRNWSARSLDQGQRSQFFKTYPHPMG